MNQRHWFNVLCKILGLYWLSYGLISGLSIAYTLFVERSRVFTVGDYHSEWNAEFLGSILMSIVGLLMTYMSTKVTTVAFTMDTHESLAASTGRSAGDDVDQREGVSEYGGNG